MLIEICKKNALIYSEKVCSPLSEYGNAFPEYFDWADHIAVTEAGNYFYHLNKIVSDVIDLAEILGKYFNQASYELWKNNWYAQTQGAAWIHDIGMIYDRYDHEFHSAKFVFQKNDYGFDFNGISLEDKIKIGLLCIKHNKGWTDVYHGMKQIIEQNEIPFDLNELFEDENSPCWELELSGKLISTADCLRHRGSDLRNNLEQSFMLWSMCKCNEIYPEKRLFCSAPNCNSKPETKSAVSHYISQNGFDPNQAPEIKIFEKSETGSIRQLNELVSDSEVTVLVRDKSQVNTQGDMSLYDVKVIDSGKWIDELKNDGIDWSELEENIFSLEEYQTVLQVSIDTSNHEAALFTLSEYITGYLHDNLSITDDLLFPNFSNRTVLHITVSDGKHFSSFFEDNSGSDETRKAIQKIKESFKYWDEEHKIVVPVQILKNRIEVIEI